MEVDVGTHCSGVNCKQLDFLPFTCDGCAKVFCLEHRSYSSHHCPSLKQNELVPRTDSLPQRYPCSLTSCSSSELVPVTCEHCMQNFCLAHRHQPDHKCSALPAPEVGLTPEEKIKQITGRELKKEKTGKGGVKNKSRAAKVAFMKLKMNAVGDKSIPQQERVYFNIALPLQCKELKRKPMFFSKEWSVGRALDHIASMCSLKNDNNIATAKKLRLFSSQAGHCILLQEKIKDAIELIPVSDDTDGTLLIIEYVNDDKDVINIEDYM